MAKQQHHPFGGRQPLPKPPRTRSMQPAAQPLRAVLSVLGASEHFRLVQLWKSWPQVIGAELSQMLKPLGAHGTVLVLGAEDSVLMQEAAFLQPEILANVNGFLRRLPGGHPNEEHFDKVRFELLSGKIPLDAVVGPPPVPEAGKGQRPTHTLARPAKVGSLDWLRREDSAVGRAYRAYVGLLDRPDTDNESGGS